MNEDMDAAAMIRRAYERGAVLESYDPNYLVGEIQDFLHTRGLNPDIPPGSGRAAMATSAAGLLLRAFGILPACDSTSIDRVNAPDDS
ncbi:MAG: hypothetical protein ACRDT2_07760 [Natronosporangium sp.]